MSVSSLSPVVDNTVSIAARPKWTAEAVLALYDMPLIDLIWSAQDVPRQHFDPTAIQRPDLFSGKTGGCSENCGYCSQ